MKDSLRAFATALMFLTRLPVSRWASGEASVLAQATQYFPLVGILIGGVGALLLCFASLLWPVSVAVALMLGALVLVTGGFHEDGLADLADSAGAWTVERRLEIMRDSRLGTYGVLALLFMLLLKYSALVSIASISLLQACTVLVLAHVVARWSSLPLIRTTPYAREDSNNKVIAEAVTDKRLFIGTAYMLLVCLIAMLISGPVVLVYLLLAMSLIALTRRWYMLRLEGVTGDALGATNTIVEVAGYLVFSAFLAN